MKNNKRVSKILKLLLLMVISYSCKAQVLPPISQPNWGNEIIGTWISNDDLDYKIEFTSNGVQKEYIGNVLQDGTYNYALTMSCGSNINNGFDVYLKRDISSNDFVCDVINNIHTDDNGVKTLSITTESGKLEIYTKQ
ncbi:hypothetical protein ACFPH8_04340 [Bizionia hallyeonensis]|uniref:Lipocalin-like domain-containing protein n=2 Tax=Bizionia TaxID=283785 RepID=A0ABW0C2V5_9FLAO